jgi:hypothetical protein
MGAPKPWLRAAISAFLLFHLLGVVAAPNPNSYLYASIAPLYRPYMNALGLGHTWGFFAPEPAAPPMYIDYIVDKLDGSSISGRFPEEGSPFFFRDRQNRRMTLSRFILSADDNIRNMFVRRFCLQNKDQVQQIRLWRTVATQVSLEQVKKGEKRMTDAAEHKIEVLGTYYCPEKLE